VLGFTRREAAVLLFLVVSFVLGIGVRIYQQRWAPLPEVAEERAVLRAAAEGYLDGEKRGEVEIEEINWPISLNGATREDLERLPGVGSVTARRIVEYREQCGGFRSVEELVEVKGIGWKTLAKLRPYLKLN